MGSAGSAPQASHADVRRGSSRVPAEPLRTSAWESTAALVPPQPQVPSIPCPLAPLWAFFLHQGALSQPKRHRPMTWSSELWNEVLHHSQRDLPVFQSPACFARETGAHPSGTNRVVAWENSRHFEMTPLLSLRNDTWETSAESPYLWCVTTRIWVVLLICWSKFPTWHDQSEALPRSRYTSWRGDASSVWNFCARFSDEWWRLEMLAVFLG